MTNDTALDSNRDNIPDNIEVLLARVQRLQDRRKLRAWLIPGGVTVAFIAAMIGLGTAGYLEAGWPVLAALVFTCGAGIWVWTVMERQEMRTIELLAVCRDKRSLGSLLDAANCSNRRVRKAVETALIELLPGVTQADSSLLNTTHREMLNALLYGKSSELALAALTAIEQVGDGMALPYLTSMAAGKGIPNLLRDRGFEVAVRARLAVERIHQRIESQNRANVLLRAAQMPDMPFEQLMRPASSQPHANSEELLRPEAND